MQALMLSGMIVMVMAVDIAATIGDVIAAVNAANGVGGRVIRAAVITEPLLSIGNTIILAANIDAVVIVLST